MCVCVYIYIYIYIYIYMENNEDGKYRMENNEECFA